MKITIKKSPYARRSWNVRVDGRPNGTLTRADDGRLLWATSNPENLEECVCVYLPSVFSVKDFSNLLKLHF